MSTVEEIQEQAARLFEDGDEGIIDYVAYLDFKSERYRQSPPDAPDGFELIECTAEPRHWPVYTVRDDDFYDGPCPACLTQDAQEQVDKLQHEAHQWWQHTRLARWAATRLYSLGIISGSSIQYGPLCTAVNLSWRGRRRYILGVSRDAWHCLLVGHHVPGEPIGFGMCGKCVPWSCCGAVTRAHAEGCEDDR